MLRTAKRRRTAPLPIQPPSYNRPNEPGAGRGTCHATRERAVGLRLIKLTREYEDELRSMLDEWSRDIETRHTNGSPSVIFRADPSDFDAYVSALEPDPVPAGNVANSVFFLLDDERGRLLGAADIRHELNDALLAHGGHIGDGIRPSERRKGYATEMIRLALLECQRLGIDRVLMTCDKDNIGSAKSILRNGGVLENEVLDRDGELVQRYWIDLKKE